MCELQAIIACAGHEPRLPQGMKSRGFSLAVIVVDWE